MAIETGGPAFPIPIAGCTDGGVYNTLEQSSGLNGGMTLRDKFAESAMLGEIMNQGLEGRVVDHIAAMSYEMADAMLKARAQEKSGE